MSTRTIRQRVPAHELTEGAGVTVHRSIGTPALRNLDPFLMLDHFGSDNPDEYIAEFPDHPHRGFITFTYMLDGHAASGPSLDCCPNKLQPQGNVLHCTLGAYQGKPG